jgi:hypothetical protein
VLRTGSSTIDYSTSDAFGAENEHGGVTNPNLRPFRSVGDFISGNDDGAESDYDNGERGADAFQAGLSKFDYNEEGEIATLVCQQEQKSEVSLAAKLTGEAVGRLVLSEATDDPRSLVDPTKSLALLISERETPTDSAL